MKNVLAALAVAAMLLASPWAAAAEQQAFSAGELSRFLTDYPQVLEFLADKGEGVEDSDPQDIWSGISADAALSAQLTTFLKARDWTMERFAYVATQTARGFAALTLQQQAPSMQEDMATARAEIEADTSLSSEMKRQILAQMAQTQAQVDAMRTADQNIPKAEMDLIRSNEESIRRVFEAE